MWFDTIAQLPFYDAALPCYCEPVVLPNDLILQGDFREVETITYFSAILMSPDGATEYESITANFDIYAFKNPVTGGYMFNARLKRFSEEMCIRECWIIRFRVAADNYGVVFDKYTQRYCTTDCCEIATGVTFSQSNIIATNGFTLPTNTTATQALDGCNEPIVRLITRYPCHDNFSGNYYGLPNDILTGDASFSYTKVTSIRGRFVPRPREITTQISYNCKLQRAESARQYLLESHELYPAWKMQEIEAQMHAPYKWVETEFSYREYQYTGGVIFTKPQGANDCTEAWKLLADMSECIVRQTFGCGDDCDSSGYQGYASFFIVPQSYTGGAIYGSNKEKIAYDIDSFVEWLHAFEGVTDVQIIAAESGSPVVSPAISPITCGYDYVIGIKTESNNVYTPTNVYFDNTAAANRVFSVTFADLEDVCTLLPPANCDTPVLGSVTLADNPCDTPVLGSTTVTAQEVVDIDMTQYTGDGWEFVTSGSPAIAEGTSASLYINEVEFSIKVINTNYPNPDSDFQFPQTRIGVIGVEARPNSIVLLNSENSDLIDEQFIIIDSQGIIYYSGLPTSISEGSYSEIELSNLKYTI